MPSEIVPRGPSSPGLRLPTRLNRDIARVEHDALVRASQVQAVTFVTKSALIGASQICALQQALELTKPSAASRLNDIADAGIAALQAEVLKMMAQP